MFVYIMQSQKDSGYYIGHSSDLNDRLARHNQGRNKYTKYKLPWKLVYIEEFDNRSEAMKREYEIKRKKSKNYVNWLINTSKSS